MATENLYAEAVLDSNNANGMNNVLGAPDDTWTTNTGNESWAARFSIDNPSGSLTSGAEHTVTVPMRKSASGGGNPGWSLWLWDNGVEPATFFANGTLDIDSRTVQGTFSTADISSGDNIEIEIRTEAANPVLAANDRAIQVESITIESTIDVASEGSHFVSAVVVDRSAHTHSIDALLSAEIQTIHSVDTLTLKTDQKTSNIDAILQKNIAHQHNTDVLLELTRQETHFVDVVILEDATREHSVNALISLRPEGTYAVDATMQDVFTAEHSVDASAVERSEIVHNTDGILKLVDSTTNSVDAISVSRLEINHLVDANIQAVPQFVNVASAIGASSVTVNISPTDGHLMLAEIACRHTQELSTVPSGWTLIRADDTSEFDTSEMGTRLYTYYKVAGVSEPGSYTWEFSDIGTPSDNDALVAIAIYKHINQAAPIHNHDGTISSTSKGLVAFPGITVPQDYMTVAYTFGATSVNTDYNSVNSELTERSHTISDNVWSLFFDEQRMSAGTIGHTDKVLSLSDSDTVALQSIVLVPEGGTGINYVNHNVDTILSSSEEASHTVDSILRIEAEINHTVDARLFAATQIDHDVDASLRETRSSTHSVDTLVQKAKIVDQEVDAVLLETRTATHQLDTLLTGAGIRQHLADALISIERTVVHSVDSILLLNKLNTHLVDARIVEPVQGSHGVDANLELTSEIDHSVDARTSNRLEAEHNADAVLQITDTGVHNVDTTLQQSQQSTHATDAAVSGAGIRLYSVDGVLELRRTPTYSVSALMQRTTTVVHASDAILELTDSSSYLVDSVLSQVSTSIHSVDARFKAVRELTQAVDANIQAVPQFTGSSFGVGQESITVNISPVEGELMIAQVACNATQQVITVPSGWNLIRFDVTADTTETGTRQYAYYKIAGAGESGSYTWEVGDI